MREENNCAFSFQEKYFLDTFPLIRQIAGRRLRGLNANAAEDIIQTVALRLWKWRTKDETRNLSAEEWRKYANVATRNEIKRYYSRNYGSEELLPDTQETGKSDSIIDDLYVLMGNTEVETLSFLRYLWIIIDSFSTRQKYALLFQKQEFIFELVARRCCTIKEVAESLELSREEFLSLIGKFPLSDEDLREVLKAKTGDDITVRQIWTARGKAKAKLAATLKDSG